MPNPEGRGQAIAVGLRCGEVCTQLPRSDQPSIRPRKPRDPVLAEGRWRPRPELNRGKRFCRPLRNHSATWPLGSRYVNGRNRLRNSAFVAAGVILNARPLLILNGCSRGVRQHMRLPLPGGGQGTFQGPLGVPLIGALRPVPRQRPALAVGQMLAGRPGSGRSEDSLIRAPYGFLMSCSWPCKTRIAGLMVRRRHLSARAKQGPT